MDRYDVVVVGARAAGASTALRLARAGLSVLVVDHGRYGSDTLSTHALMRGGVRQLDRLCVLDAVKAAGTPPIEQVRFAYADGNVGLPVRPTPGVDALYAPRRTVLDRLLVDAAIAAGVEVRYGVDVVGLEHAPGGRVVGVRARTGRGPAESLRARLVVGADGRRSTVARAAGAALRHSGRFGGSGVYGYWSGIPFDGYEWAYRPGATAGFIPTNDGLLCAFAGSTPERVGRGGWTAFWNLLSAASPSMAERLAAGTLESVVRTFPGSPGHLRQAWGPGWALVGDAGSYKDPISSHGLTDALRDAELLSCAALAALRDGDDERTAFDAYEQARDRNALPLLALSDEIVGYRWSAATIRPLTRAMSDAMNALGPSDCGLVNVKAGRIAGSWRQTPA
ncbi:NAD(P)/FAD-dependent oxidoreductase [Cryptosporangium phraense]|uniref:NAD(P)/FAD-dependent oxidoreductase n=1 Tax=Cryptosporangium phraense TaxID=2593070 RepID=UPI001478FAEF|nr:NAD(P)/FAD-dependent oxidoreductase [Cryptosporangium phraense]